MWVNDFFVTKAKKLICKYLQNLSELQKKKFFFFAAVRIFQRKVKIKTLSNKTCKNKNKNKNRIKNMCL